MTVKLVGAPDPAQGVAKVVGRKIRFTPTDGFSGVSIMDYSVCEDPMLQIPPYVDEPECGLGKAVVIVAGNEAPGADPDEAVTLTDTPVADFDVAVNDTDPEGTPLTCQSGPVETKNPELIASATIDDACHLDVTPVAGAGGVGHLDYTVCDSHLLSPAPHAANPYGTDGRNPGDPAARCSTSVVMITVFAPLVAEPVDFDPLPACPPDDAVTPAGVARQNLGGELPRTGAGALTAAGTGLALLGAGGLLRSLTRRRRV